MTEPTKYTKESGDAIGRMINSFSFSPKAVAQYIAQREHRTIQQSLTRFCMAWLEVCASDDYGYDGRNEARHKLAKKLLDGKTDLPGLPMI